MDGLESIMLKENASLKNHLSYESFYMKYPGQVNLKAKGRQMATRAGVGRNESDY